MPSITTYSPYETLVFFQSVARHGSHTSALQDIATALRQNEQIREDSNFDANRFSTDALQDLYKKYINTRNATGDQLVNGDTQGERSPKRRKLSHSPQPQDGVFSEEEQQLQGLVEKLYTRFKEEALREVKEHEEAYGNLQREISALEFQLDADTKRSTSDARENAPTFIKLPQMEDDSKANSNANTPQQSYRPSSSLDKPKPSSSSAASPNEVLSVPILPSQRQEVISTGPNVQPSRSPQLPGLASQTQSPSAFLQQGPAVPAQSSVYGQIQSQPIYHPNQTPSGHATPHIPSGQQRPHARPHQSGGQSRGSPIPYATQHPYAPYPQYPQPQWHPQMPPQSFQHSPYSTPQPYYPQNNGRHPQTPQQIPYVPYPHTAPVHYMPQQQHWRTQQWPIHPASMATTPVSRPDSRSLPVPGSSTPWKRKQQNPQRRSQSPHRPEREISPLTDREDSPLPIKPSRGHQNIVSKATEGRTPPQPQPRKRGRPASVTPAAVVESRSQSVASKASDTQRERSGTTRKGQNIKAEPPSTPLPIPSSDTEQRSSGRRGRHRASAATIHADSTRVNNKRKRDSVSPNSPTRSPQPPHLTSSSFGPDQVHDPSLIIVSKNFAKTSQLLLSEIASHKLAGIFAKPLSERDAPGYKDLVLRPQDLKSIKAATSKGGRAAIAAIEAIEGDDDATATTGQISSALLPSLGPIGNGFYLVPKTAELVPPKGIVNSAQLEMELVRTFANAVMFNPLPASERGFGRTLRLRKNGGDVDANVDLEAMSASDESESASSSGADEDGIISDAREMFNDVVEMVGKWRELEGERRGPAIDSSASRHGSLAVPVANAVENGRHASVSVGSNVGDDDAAPGENETTNTPVPNTSSGPGRKRRRLAE